MQFFNFLYITKTIKSDNALDKKFNIKSESTLLCYSISFVWFPPNLLPSHLFPFILPTSASLTEAPLVY